MSRLPKTVKMYILSSLIPYTDANMKLVFKPNWFFNDIEKISGRNRLTVRNQYYKLLKEGYIATDIKPVPVLTAKGRSEVQRYMPVRLKGAELFVMFDIPEEESYKRQHLRRLLKTLEFEQIQKSVWSSPYDYREYLEAEIQHYQLSSYVKVYEAVPIKV